MSAQQTDIATIRGMVEQVLAAQPGARESRSQARADILTHATCVFADQGVQKTTVQDILDASSVSRRTFYKYFQSKYEVLEQIHRVFVDNMLLHFQEQMAAVDSVDDLLANMVTLYFDYHASVGPAMQLLVEESRHSSSVLAPHRDRAHKVVADILVTEIGRLTGRYIQPLVFRSILWMMENHSLYIFANKAEFELRLVQSQETLVAMVTSLLLGTGAEQLLTEPERVSLSA